MGPIEGLLYGFGVALGLQNLAAAYARALAAAGVAAEHRHYPGLVHGYLQLAGYSKEARTAVDDAVAALRRAFRE